MVHKKIIFKNPLWHGHLIVLASIKPKCIFKINKLIVAVRLSMLVSVRLEDK